MKKNKNKGIIHLLPLILVGAIIAVAGGYFYFNQNSSPGSTIDVLEREFKDCNVRLISTTHNFGTDVILKNDKKIEIPSNLNEQEKERLSEAKKYALLSCAESFMQVSE